MLVGYGQVNQRDEDPERRTDRSDGGGGARRRRPAGAGGGRLGTGRQHPVVALPRSGPTARSSASAPNDASTPLHGRWRQRAADAGQPGVPGHPVRTRRPRAHRRRRNLPHPNAIARPRHRSRDWTSQDESVPFAEGANEGLPMVGPAETPDQSGPARLCLPAVRAGAADRCGGVVRTTTAGASANCGPSSATWHETNPHAWSRDTVVGRGDLAAERRQPDDQLALHQADELEQHGRSGRGGHPGGRGEGQLICRSPPSVGFSRIREPTRTTPTRSANARSCTGRRRSASAVSERSNWPSVGVDDIGLIDVYSCFPSAVQVAAAELGLPLGDADRPLTVTGGLTFAGGPWNNYVTHSIATMAERLVANPGAARPDHRQRRLAHQAQLRRLRLRATRTRIPLGRRSIRRRRRTDKDRRGRVDRRRHRRILDHTVRPRRRPRRRRSSRSARPTTHGRWQ